MSVDIANDAQKLSVPHRCDQLTSRRVSFTSCLCHQNLDSYRLSAIVGTVVFFKIAKQYYQLYIYIYLLQYKFLKKI